MTPHEFQFQYLAQVVSKGRNQIAFYKLKVYILDTGPQKETVEQDNDEQQSKQASYYTSRDCHAG
jgi:hypothetical protein